MSGHRDGKENKQLKQQQKTTTKVDSLSTLISKVLCSPFTECGGESPNYNEDRSICSPTIYIVLQKLY